MSVQVEIVDGPLHEASPWTCPNAGALLSFEGVVRPEEDAQPIKALHYQTYDPMAELGLQRLAQESVARFELLAIRVEHSRGTVPARSCSFRLRVAARHRKEALAAMDWFIDRMKQDVPIWKRPIPILPHEAPP